MWVYKWIWVTLCFLLLNNAAFGAQSFNSSGYHLVEIIALGGECRWDYLTLDNQATVSISRVQAMSWWLILIPARPLAIFPTRTAFTALPWSRS